MPVSTTPSPWPPAPPPAGREQYGPHEPFAPQQVDGPRAPYGPQQPPVAPYGGQPPLPHDMAPRPEKPLMPAVWWSLVINLVTTFLLGLLLLLIGWFLVELVTGFARGEMSWSETLGADVAGTAVLVVALGLLGSLLVSWLLTVASLVLWRLVRGFRTIPAFVQALVAYVSMWVVTTVITVMLQLAFGLFGAVAGGMTTY